MEFGRIPHIEKIDFSLPADAVMTEQVLGQALRDNLAPLRCYVGGTGWGQPNWIGKAYPRGTKPKDFLLQYARQFNSIELNALWYNLQPKPVIEKWASMVDPSFRFCPKVSNTISHELQLVNAGPDTRLFIDHMQCFGRTLGPSFLQLAESFSPARAAILEDYLRQLPRSFRLAVELRHEGWFGTAAVRATWELFRELGIGAVITDTPGRRDVLHMRLTAPFAFIRFVANQQHPTDFQRIDEWADRLSAWVEKGLREMYFFVHDHQELYVPELCLYAVQRFNEKFGAGLEPPKLFTNDPPAGNLTLF
jgi:uncharacterized protein YecE (DUF72 family)